MNRNHPIELPYLQKNIALGASLIICATVAMAQASVGGTVVDGEGKPIAGATIVLQRVDTHGSQETNSDFSGAFQFSATEPGTHTLTADVPGFYPSSYEFVLRPRQELSVSIEMLPRRAM